MRQKYFGRNRLWLVFMLALSACTLINRTGASDPPAAELFLPLTPTVTSQAAAAVETAVPLVQATPTVGCQDNLTFLTDITIPDGTVVSPSSTMDKRWQVENSGNCNWGKDYRLRLIAGSEMSAQPEQALYPARSGTRTVLRVVFIAPQEPGVYRSAWQAFDPQGEPFGDPFFIEVNVQ